MADKSILLDEVKFTRTVMANKKFITTLISVWESANTVWDLDNEQIFRNIADPRINKIKGFAENIQIVGNKHIYDIISVMNTTEGNVSLEGFNKLHKLAGIYERISPITKLYDVREVLQAFIVVKDTLGVFIEKEAEKLKEQEQEQKSGKEQEKGQEKERGTEKESRRDAEFYDKMQQTWGNKVDSALNGLMETFSALYESCYDVGKPGGILTNQGIVKTTTEGKKVTNGDMLSNIELFTYIQELLPGTGIDKYIPGTSIDIKQLLNARTTAVLYDIHLQFMFGHFRFCKGLQSYIEKNEIKKGVNTVRVLNYSVMNKWIRSRIKNYIYDAMADCGIGYDIPIENVQDTLKSATDIMTVLFANFRNVIVVCDLESGQNTRIRISSDGRLKPASVFASELESKLNVGSVKSTKVEATESKAGIIDVNIIYNEQRYKKASLFAHEVLDTLMEQGIKPGWNSVILGKNLKGKTVRYNFKDDKNPAFAMYAGSRSGKGVMTLNLLSSALADGCKVIYVDAKPDMTQVIGNVAWKAGKEAMVFNGYDKTGCLETGSPRESISFQGIEDIPDALFTSFINGKNVVDVVDKKGFYRLMQYYKVLELFGKMVQSRAEAQLASKGYDDWMVGVFDEVQQLAAEEARLLAGIEEKVSLYEKDIKAAASKKGGDDNVPQDKVDAVNYYKSFKSWTAKIVSEWAAGVGSTFGKACVTVIFVWQTSTFPSGDASKSGLKGSMLNEIVSRCKGKFIKIIGRGGIEQGGMTAFGNASTKGPWYDNKFSGDDGGYFAITGDVASETAMVFRPYNIYSDANGLNKILDDANKVGLKPNDLIGSSLMQGEDGEFQVIPEVGFEGYINKFLGMLGMDPATQIQASFDYTNEYLTSKFNIGLLDYMYSSKFSLDTLNDPEEMPGESSSGLSSSIDLGSGTNEEVEESNTNTASSMNEESSGIDLSNFGRETVHRAPEGSLFDAEEGDEEEEDLLGDDWEDTPGSSENTVRETNEIPREIGNTEEDAGDTEDLLGDDESIEEDLLGDDLSTEMSDIDEPEVTGGLSDEIHRGQEESRDTLGLGNAVNTLNETTDRLSKMLSSIEQRMSDDTSDDEVDDRERWKRLREVQEQQLVITKTLGELARVMATMNQAQPTFNMRGNNAVYSDRPQDAPYRQDCSFKNSLVSTFSIGKRSLSRKFASWRGTDYLTKSMFTELVRELERQGVNFWALRKAGITQNAFIVNNRYVDIGSLGYDDKSFDLVDIVDFTMIEKKMKNLSELTLDSEGFNRLYQNECKGTSNDYLTAVVSIFNKMPNLTSVVHMKEDGESSIIYRDQLSSPQMQERMDRLKEESVLKNRISLLGAKDNTRVVHDNRLIAKTRNAVCQMQLSGAGTKVPKNLLGIGVSSAGLAMAGAVFGAPLVLGAAAIYGIHSIAKMGQTSSAGSTALASKDNNE